MNSAKGVRPEAVIEACADSHARWLGTLASLTDDQATQPSRLPDWSRAHVITHLARKSDSHVWLFGGARVDEVRVQYPRPNMQQEDIEAGARRSASELRADLTGALERIERAFEDLPDDRWDRLGVVAPGERTMAEIVFRHLRDVEVHHVDVDMGYEPSNWPRVYVEGELARRLPRLTDRADHAELVAWLLGRGPAPTLGPW